MIGILGGTFDPVHHGHLRLALEVRDAVGLAQVRLIPASQPPHRDAPRTPADLRLAMLERAVEGTAGLVVDPRELERDGPSYTVDTLASLRMEFPSSPLCLIIGMDAFCLLDTWHRWRELTGLTHLVVARRPGAAGPRDTLAELMRDREVRAPSALRDGVAGAIYIQDVPQLDISATRIRGLLAGGLDPRYLLPDPVLAFIRERGLYGA